MNLKRIAWRLRIAGAVLLLIALAIRNHSHAVFGPDASVADMIAGLAGEVRRHPSRASFTVYRYSDESARRLHWLNTFTLNRFPRNLHPEPYFYDCLFYDRTNNTLRHGKGWNSTQGLLIFPDTTISNVFPETLFAAAKQRGDWCTLRRLGGREDTFNHAPWGCSPG